MLGGETFRTLLSAMSFGGRLLVVGSASGTIPHCQPTSFSSRTSASAEFFFGAWSGANPLAAVELHERILDWCAARKLNPHVSRVFPLSEAVEAMRFVGSRQATGRVLLQICA